MTKRSPQTNMGWVVGFCFVLFVCLFVGVSIMGEVKTETKRAREMEEEQTVEDIILKNDMQPHPEGGFFKVTYRSDTRVHVTQDDGSIIERSAATAIVFLITDSNISRPHRLKSDETWHFYGGSPLVVWEWDSSTLQITNTRMGPNILEGEVVQHVVPAGKWFGSYSEGAYSFVGNTVSPGFEFSDFELASSEQLRRMGYSPPSQP